MDTGFGLSPANAGKTVFRTYSISAILSLLGHRLPRLSFRQPEQRVYVCYRKCKSRVTSRCTSIEREMEAAQYGLHGLSLVNLS